MKGRFVVLLLVLAIAVAGCGGPAATVAPTQPPATQAPPKEPVSIEVFYPVAVDAPIAKILQGYIEKFEAANADVKVKAVFSGGYADLRTALQTTVSGGGKPPALAVMLASDLYDFINLDYIAPLDDYVAKMANGQAYLNDFYPAFLANSRYEGKLYSIPFQRSAVVLYYNADMFSAAGLQPPTSWQEWAAAAQKLTVREGSEVKQWGMLFPSDNPYWLFQPLAIGNGQNIFGEGKDAEVFFDNPKVVEAIQFYIDLSKVHKAMPEGVQANWGQASSEFAAGKVGMIAHTTGSLAGILKSAQFKVGVMPYPGNEKGTFASVPGGGNLYIFKNAPKEQQDAAWRFVEFITSPELAADYSINTGYIASRQSAYDTQAMKDYLAKVPQAVLTRDALKYAGAEFSVQNLAKVRKIFNDAVQLAYNGQATAAAAMTTAQKDADKELAAFK